MIVEERIYTLRPGGVPRYLQLWHELGRTAQVEILGRPLGVFTCDVGDLNTLTYLWSFSSHQDRATRRTLLMQDDTFAHFRSAVRELVVRQQNRMLVPVDEEGRVR
jgi:hypothetical protein